MENTKKNVEKFETQQKTLELALECLENNSKLCPDLTIEQKNWLFAESMDSMCCIQKDALKILMESANLEKFKEYVIQNKPIECLVELFNQKPLKECSLKEVIDGIKIVFRTSHLFDTIDSRDDGNYYLLIVSHSLGLNGSKLNLTTFESVFYTYGVDFKSIISEKTIFMKVFKD